MKVLIFGGTGSLGKKLVERFLDKTATTCDKDVYVYSRDEAKQWTLRNEFLVHPHNSHLHFIVGDIRDISRVRETIQRVKPQVVIIAAALKQVDTCELSPEESIKTNLLGTQNVIQAIQDFGMTHNDIESVLFVSTDKACAPVNVYGMCKATSERVVTSQAKTGHSKIKFLCTRYGNVLESRGSIIPLFKYQCQNSEFLTVTDPDMTRFLMTLDDSVDLILKALADGKSGETWIPKLPSMKIGDLADIFSSRYKKPVKIIGVRPGEKKHEDLINESESVRTKDIGSHYVIGPAIAPATEKPFTFSSGNSIMTKDALEKRLIELNIFDMSLEEFKGLKIEEIVTNRKQ